MSFLFALIEKCTWWKNISNAQNFPAVNNMRKAEGGYDGHFAELFTHNQKNPDAMLRVQHTDFLFFLLNFCEFAALYVVFFVS